MADPFSSNTSLITSYVGNTGIKSTLLPKSVFDSYVASPTPPFSTSTNLPDSGGDVLANSASGTGTEAWVFITAPGTVSYTQQSEVTRLDIFGTNSPPVVVGAKGMRDLTLSDALIEGFTLGRSVQPHIDRLEQLMNVSINVNQGFVNIPVYNVFAGPAGSGKNYGYYVIEQVEIEEQMRDLKGNATRAMVGVSLKQVPKYQVGTGVDQAGASTGGKTLDPSKFTDQASKQDGKVKGSKDGTKAGAAAGGDTTGDGASTNTGASGSRWRGRYLAETGREAKF